MFRDEMKKATEDFGLTLSENQLVQFTRYYELLVEWNEKMNLTAITEEHEVAVKHMVDSLSAYDPTRGLPRLATQDLLPAGAPDAHGFAEQARQLPADCRR